MTVPAPIADALERHLASFGEALPPEATPEEAERYMKAVGLAPGEPGMPGRLMRGALEEARRAGIGPGELFAIFQAYGRGMGRIASAEAEIVRRLVRDAPPEGRAEALEDLLSRSLPVSAMLLHAIHRARLWKELEDNLDEEALDEPDTADRTIALVDIVSSTRFLAEAGAEETERMVDAIHEAGQGCTAGRGVTAVKYAGDGVFLLGRDPPEVVETALDAVRLLDRALPLAVRAGLATGPVVRRAGDYFGLTVNLTHRLVSAAPVGTVLAEQGSAHGLPDSIEGEEMTKELRGIPGPTACVALRWRDAAAS
jgi:class 3 adenylate cyclase